MTRRTALRLGATIGAGVVGATAVGTGIGSAAPSPIGNRERSFDEGWRFFRGDARGAQAPEFDDGAWRQLDLPHDWSIEDLPHATSTDGAATSDPSLLVYKDGDENAPDLPEPPKVIGPFDIEASAGGTATGYTIGGIGWYRKHFTLAEVGAENAHVELRFDGVYQNADVWLNGVHLGFHPYGYTSFAYDLTPHLKRSGTNVLAVRVDNTGENSRWYAGSGIYRHTWLTVTGSVRVPLWGVRVTTPEVGHARSTARVETSVANLGTHDVAAGVRVTVLDPNGNPVATGAAPVGNIPVGATSSAAVDLTVEGARWWSPNSPSVYTARTEVVIADQTVDTVDTTFGFRTVTWNGTEGLLINGEPVEIRGANLHHDHGPLGAVALDRSEQRRVEILKDAGFNSIRTAHNPPTPALLDICDRLGMLVMDEFVDMWDEAKTPNDYSRHFSQWWRRDLTDMVLRDRNHPSVVMWSLGNEIWSDRSVGAPLAKLVRSLDLSRPITLGWTFEADDVSWGYVDIGDVHYQSNGEGYEEIHQAHPHKPMTQNESFPATVAADETFTAERGWAIGNWIWTAWDYLGEAGIGKTLVGPEGTQESLGDMSVNPGWQAADEIYNAYGGWGYRYPYFQGNCGDFDLIGQRKPQGYWRSAVWGVSPVAMLVRRPTPPGTEQVGVKWGYFDELASWTWDVEPGRQMTVRVYTPGDSVRLLLDGEEFPEGAARGPNEYVATFTVPYRAGELTAVASEDGEEIGRTTLTTTGAPAAVRLTSDVDALTTGRDDLAHVLVSVTDAHGRVVPDAVTEVSFTVHGAGELAAVGNGNPHNVDSFRLPRRHTWHGRALAILRPAKHPGQLTLTAEASGLRAAAVTLPVRG